MLAGNVPAMSAGFDVNNHQTGVSYDANGNQLTSPGASYDIENRVSWAVKGNPAPGAGYGYDPDNRRVYRSAWTYDMNAGWTLNSETVEYFGVGGQKVGSYTLGASSSGLTLVAAGYNVYFGARLVRKVDQYGGWSTVRADRLGSFGKYYPYGDERGTTPDGTEKFGTYYRDADTGLDYAVNRYYSSGSGRFLTADPYDASRAPSDPGSWNRYSYVGGDPANGNDPEGLIIMQVGIGLCTVGAGERMEMVPCEFYSTFNPPKIREDVYQDEWDNLSEDCKEGLRGKYGATANIKAMLQNVNRAVANMATLEVAASAHGIEPALLAAIGLKESNFVNKAEVDGAGVGVGVFQITVGSKTGVTAAQAGDLTWAANYAADMLSTNMAYLAAKFPSFTADQILQATAASYNLGKNGISGNPATIDKGTTGQPRDSYGSNVVQLMKCFE